MESFYKIVIGVAIVFLILILTGMGILLNLRNNSQVYPPTKNDCPDYWTSTISVSDGKSMCILNSKNKGIIDTDHIDPSKTPGYSNSNFNFSDPGWASNYSTTNLCALKKWTNLYNISWDGVSNYNGCN